MSNQGKDTLLVFMQRERVSPKSKRINEHLNNHISQINMLVTRIYVDANNLAEIRRTYQINSTPCAIFIDKSNRARKMIYDIDPIIAILTPLRATALSAFSDSPYEDYIAPFKNPNYDMDEETDDTILTPDNIQRRQLEFQRKRPEMQDVDPRNLVKGGKARAPQRNVAMPSFDDDASFMAAAGFTSTGDNIVPTHHSYFSGEADGDLILEEDRLALAFEQGKQVKASRYKSRARR